MSTEDTACDSSQGTRGANRITPLGPQLGLCDELWADVHSEIQQQFSSLEDAVRSKINGVGAQQGKTCGNRFVLFSYRKFYMPGCNIDPVVVGITITGAGNEVQIDPDISGEQLGDLILCLPKYVAGASRTEIINAARNSARTFQQATDLIVAALRDPSRQIA